MGEVNKKRCEKMKKLLRSVIALILMLVFSLSFYSCRAGKHDSESVGTESPSVGAPDGGSGNSSGGIYYPGKDEYADNAVILSERKIIKTVNETLETRKYDELVERIRATVSELGGYIQSAYYSGDTLYEDEEALRSANLTVRIPAERLSEFTEKIEKDAAVTYYNEYMNDVTNSYVDIESRISVYEAEETALLEMLSKATDVATVLKIRERLNVVQADLASYRAQKKQYDGLIAYSTVYLGVREVRDEESEEMGFFDEVGTRFNDSLDGIGGFFRSLAVWLIGDFLYILIFAALIFAALVVFVKLYKRKKRLSNLLSEEREGEGESEKDGK